MGMLPPASCQSFRMAAAPVEKKRNNHNSQNTLVSPSGNSPEFKFIIFLSHYINICNHLAHMPFQALCLSCACEWVHAQKHSHTCLLFVCVEQVWGCTHGWLSNRCWCSASAARPCSWIIKPRAITAFTQINQREQDAYGNWVSGYFLQHTWANSKRWVSIINGCRVAGPALTQHALGLLAYSWWL